MKALVYRKSIPRYALVKLLGGRFRSLYTSGLPALRLTDIAPPKLPNEKWVRVAPKMAGICGSDLATICAKGTPYLAPVTSMPFVMGHEVVGVITEVGSDAGNLSAGDRVVLHPALGCEARGIDPVCDACSQHRDALCRNATRGDISAGLQTGFCRDTGGGFSESFVAHRCQVYKVPAEISNETAVLIEPFACALHGALRVSLTEDQTALVIGCGSIGLLTIAALRATGCKARIVAIARHEHQKRLAMAFGATELLGGGSWKKQYPKWAAALDAEILTAELGKPAVVGGVDVTFDCVASSRSIDDGIRFTKSGGSFVLVGMPGMPFGIDWTPLWFKELTLHAAYAYGPEKYAGGIVPTFDIAIELMREWKDKLVGLVGTPFALHDYRSALKAAINTGESRTAKTLFSID
jgi:threonine dehydrogenase-like Zn-dependent dehydrogenase